MSEGYNPIIFDASTNTGRKANLPLPWPFPWSVSSADGGELPFPFSVSHGGELPYPFSIHKLTTVHLMAGAGQECHEFTLAKISGWPETKVEWNERCVRVFGRRICTKVPVVYHRNCTLEVVIEVCYPVGCLNDVTNCISGAALAAAIAAVISSGAAAAGTFKAALEACLLAKGAAWANQISVNVPGPKTVCGDWHPV